MTCRPRLTTMQGVSASSYRPTQARPINTQRRANRSIAFRSNSFDLVFSTSLFTHLLEAELENYLRKSYRLWRAGGAMMHSHFSHQPSPCTLWHPPYLPAPDGSPLCTPLAMK